MPLLLMPRASQNRADICQFKLIKRSLDEQDYTAGNKICKSSNIGKNKQWLPTTDKMSARMKYAKSICTKI